MIKAVIFDLDDTLYNERQFVRLGFMQAASFVAEHYSIDRNKAYFQFLRVLKKYGRGKVFDIALKKLGLVSNKRIIAALLGLYRYSNTALALPSEARYILCRLKKNKIKVGLLTDGCWRVQKHKVRALGIEPFFDCLVFSRRLGIKHEKPSAYGYRRCLEKLKTLPEETIYVGDNPYKDFVNAKKLGMPTLRILKGRFKAVKVSKEFDAHSRISSLKNIPKIITALNRAGNMPSRNLKIL